MVYLILMVRINTYLSTILRTMTRRTHSLYSGKEPCGLLRATLCLVLQWWKESYCWILRTGHYVCNFRFSTPSNAAETSIGRHKYAVDPWTLIEQHVLGQEQGEPDNRNL